MLVVRANLFTHICVTRSDKTPTTTMNWCLSSIQKKRRLRFLTLCCSILAEK